MSLADLLFADPADPGDLAVVEGERSWSLGELRVAAESVTSELQRVGVGPGEVVAVSLPSGPEVVAALFGVWKAGAVYLPINPRLTDTEVERILEVVPPAALVALPDDDGSGAGLQVSAAGRDRRARFEDDIALVQLTSGTTGRPKPVLLRHSGVLRLLDGVIGSLRGSAPRSGASGDAPAPMPNLIPVSLSLWAGIYNVLFARRVGAPVVVLDPFRTGEFASVVGRYGIRSTVLPPAAMTMLADDPAVDDLAPLRYVRSITAPLSPLQARRFRDRFGIAVLNCYGQTEIGGEIVGWTAADSRQFGESKLGSVGRPHEGVTVRVVDGDGQTLAADESGELWVKTPAMSAGYADGADLGERLSPDGWFRTGDVGRVDPEGFVWIEGRVSDMINRGGLKVFPAEVAEVLRLSPDIDDAAVVGVPDERLGEVPVAFVVPRDDALQPDGDALDALCREHLAPYKVPVRFVAIDALPRNEIGKVLSADLVARATADR